ncbi:MAG: cytochrome C assembly protein [Planctomycetota bacterium]|nr:cytochrome C assembly protein [Planctomycetota bacterium]
MLDSPLIGSWLTRISLSCFALSYAVALILEISRLFFQIRIRSVAIFAMMIAGLFTHSTYLWLKFQADFAGGTPLASWYDWCLVVSLALAVTYTVVALQKAQQSVGIFFLPIILCLILFALTIQDRAPFSARDAVSVWAVTHGVSLLAGTVAMAVAFAAGVMYLIQAGRLKRKIPPRAGFRLPSLEWLERCNRRSLFSATALIMIGLFSGILMNLGSPEAVANNIPWTDLVVVSSAILLIWLLTLSVFEMVYKPARQGRKIAYLTLASFVFLLMVLGLAILSQHAEQSAAVVVLKSGGGI